MQQLKNHKKPSAQSGNRLRDTSWVPGSNTKPGLQGHTKASRVAVNLISGGKMLQRWVPFQKRLIY